MSAVLPPVVVFSTTNQVAVLMTSGTTSCHKVPQESVRVDRWTQAGQRDSRVTDCECLVRA